MRTIVIVALNQLKRTLRMRGVLLNMFLLPLIIIFLLGTALSGAEDIGSGTGGTIDPITLALVENGAPSALVTDFLQQEGVSDYLNVLQVESRDVGQEMLRSGKVSYALVVPTNFDQSVYAGSETALELIRGKREPDNQVAESILNPFVDTLNDRIAAVKELGPQVLMASVNAVTPRVHVQDGTLGARGENYTTFQYYAASMLVMFMMYAGMTLSGSLNGERDNRTLQRMYAMPLNRMHLFAGKVVAAGIVSGMQALTIILVSKFLYGVDWGEEPWMLVGVCLLMIAFTMGMAVVVTLLTSSHMQSVSIIQAIIMVMTFLSGGFFPFEGWLQRVGMFTVNHWASESVLRMMLHQPTERVGASVAVLAIISGGLLLVSLALYARKGYAYE